MKSRAWKAAALGLLVGTMGLVASPLRPVLDLEEDAGLGLLFRLRGPRKPPGEAVVVSIDRESSEQLGIPDNPDKWPRSLHARLTEVLSREGARAVSFDLHFIEPRDAADDDTFAAAMRKGGNVLLTEQIRTKDIPLRQGDPSAESSSHNVVRAVPPIDLFADAAVATAAFTLPRIPFKVSRFFTFEPGAGDSPSMPMATLQVYGATAYGDFVSLLEKASPGAAGRLPRDLSGALAGGTVTGVMKQIQGIFLADPALAGRMRREIGRAGDAPGGSARRRLLEALVRVYEAPNSRCLNYYGPPGTITTIPYYEALQLRDGVAAGRRYDLKDRAVFVGLSEAVLAERKDSFYTVFSRANGAFIGGVEISATAFSNLLDGTSVQPIGALGHVLVLLLWGIAVGAVCRLCHVGVAALGVVVMGAAYLAAAWYRFKSGGVWMPVAVPLFLQAPVAFVGGVIWNHLDTRKEQVRVRRAFEQYLPKKVIDQLLENLGDVGASAETVHGVCLFTDAEHYTTLSETLDPKELGAFMNRYYETLFRPVKEHGGVVSNLSGDSMLAIWVSATPDAALREKACLAAIDIQKAVGRLYDPADPRQLKTRIGLHYGDLFLGNIGAMDRYQHTVMGDIVNTASRMEALNKHIGTRVLVSAATVEQLGGLLTRDLGSFQLKGKTRPVGIHELVGRLAETGREQREACRFFAEGLSAFQMRSWDEAAARFRRALDALKDDEPSRFYLGLCERYAERPPAEPWDGVVHMDSK